MARSARLVVPDCPHHIVHRGHNREPVFLGEEDYRHYLQSLFELKQMFRCRLYAYCLMPNHVHLLIDPGADPKNLSLLMKHVAGRQARYYNQLHGRRGPVWEGRYRSSPVAPPYVLPCSRYIELNPMRAYLAEQPQDYAWSSYRSHLGIDGYPLDRYSEHATYFVNDPASYRRYVISPSSHSELTFLRDAIHGNRITGDESFGREIARKLGLRVRHRRRGRPRKCDSVTING